MKKESIGTALALRYLKCDSIDSLDQRILLQKKLYLAQACGANFGHRFHWYIHGPYSKDLTNVAYEVIPQADEELDGYKLRGNITQILDNINRLSTIKPDTLTESSWYELIASLVYLREDYGIEGLKNKRDVITKLKVSKPWYEKNEIEMAWKIGETICNG
ncbi:MAG: hypothetical protein GXY34_13440 [Syntrophomonadaceae bacterium]|nr:hypothetical protein [Syntrophomonadaceae bacterium]